MTTKTEINERIKVRADFTPGGKIVPLLFRRGRQDPFGVRKINAVWEDREGGGRTIYYSVLVDRSDDLFQLRYRENDRTWWIDSVLMDG